MDSETAGYAPDFPLDRWSRRDLPYLKPFFTNPDGFVNVIRNLPPEIVGALCSRASRAPGSLLRVFLDEYVYPIADGPDKDIAVELRVVVNFLREHGFKKILNNQRAQGFYAKWLAQYGDDSIAQMTGTHVVFWGLSQVAMKYVEDQRIGLEPIEQSTRFVNFKDKVGGRYRYYVPKPDLERLGFLEEYAQVLDHLFDTYVALQESLIAWFKANYQEKDSVLEKKAFDTLRGLLPMATLGQVAFRGNAQVFELLVNRTAAHHLGELRWVGTAVKEELDKEIPSLLLRLGDEKSKRYQEYLAGRLGRVRRYLDSDRDRFFYYHSIAPETKPEVRLVEYDLDAEAKLVTAILFPATHLSWDDLLGRVKNHLTRDEWEAVVGSYLEGRDARWQKVGRAFENSYLRFEIVMNIGAYRDLHRHRMLTQERQPFSTHHGYDVPNEIREGGLLDRFAEALDRAHALYTKIASRDGELAQYVVPLAYRIRFYQYQNLREFFWETELRTIAQGHPDYRTIEQEKFRLVQAKFPLVAKWMQVDMNDYPFARRGVEERIKAKETEILRKLGEK